jgi:hypothetical protein
VGRSAANSLIALANGLLPQQDLFVAAFLKNGRNAKRAAIEAKYSPNSGKALLKNPRVMAEINRRLAEYAKAAGIDRVEWLEKLKAVVEVDRREFFLPGGGIRPPEQWSEIAAKAVSAYNAGTVTAAEKITFGDYFQQVLEVLKYVHPLTTKHEVQHTHRAEIDSDDIVAQLRARGREVRGEVIDVTPS